MIPTTILLILFLAFCLLLGHGNRQSFGVYVLIWIPFCEELGHTYQVWMSDFCRVSLWTGAVYEVVVLKNCYLVAELCLTVCDPMDCSLQSSVHGISHARILEWIAISFSRGSSRPRDWTHVTGFGRQILTAEPAGNPLYEKQSMRFTPSTTN